MNDRCSPEFKPTLLQSALLPSRTWTPGLEWVNSFLFVVSAQAAQAEDHQTTKKANPLYQAATGPCWALRVGSP